MQYLGFDIGGSSVKAALVKNKKIIKSVLRDLPDSLDGLLTLIGQMKDELMESLVPAQIGGAGFSLAGIMDAAREKMLDSQNIKYLNGQPIGDLLQQICAPWRIKLEHDAHCFLLAEKEIGAAREFNNVFYLTLGTGVGSAFMIGGKIIAGTHGAAGEAGRAVMDFEKSGAEYRAENTQDLEELASNKFIEKELGAGSIEAQKMAEDGDKKALEVLEKLGRNLGVGIANIINIFEPEALILGGGVSELKKFIVSGVEEEIENFVATAPARATPILFSKLGRFAGALGAALMMENEIK